MEENVESAAMGSLSKSARQDAVALPIGATTTTATTTTVTTVGYLAATTPAADNVQDEDDEATEDEEEEEEEEVDDEGNQIEHVFHNQDGDVDGVVVAVTKDKGVSEQSREDCAHKVAEMEEDHSKHAETTNNRRGRTGETALDMLAESIHRETEVSLPREKEAAPTSLPSFLSDSLTDVERRTRTRFLPNVDGIHSLRKQEVKSDLALARSMTTSLGVACTLGRKVRRAREDEMDVGDTFAPSDEDKASEILRVGTRSIEVRDFDYEIPCPAFVAPSTTGISGNGDNGGAKGTPTNPPPTVVGSIAAFNPPRPPESVGPKKKHRMLRWERRPSDIEVDLNTYRKTVQKTREELKKAMKEKDRIAMMDYHLRRHFLNHLACMNEELCQLSEETTKMQQECVSAADLLTSRTRSRGAGKSGYVMRDVLAVLRARGAELQEKGSVPFSQPRLATAPATKGFPRGVGGVGEKSFQLLDNSLRLKARKPCQGWTTVGDQVSTPYGQGKVIKILPRGKLESAQDATAGAANRDHIEDVDMMDVDQPDKQQSSIDFVASKNPNASGPMNEHLLPPRVAVQFSFGVGFFPPSAIESMEDPASFSDSRLAQRWRGLIDSAQHFGEVLDIEAMSHDQPSKQTNGDLSDGDALGASVETDEIEAEAIGNHATRFLPFGSDLIPTAIGRGALVSQKNMDELDRTFTQVYFGGASELGRKDNIGVPVLLREAEEKLQNRIVMKARLRQLKNEVARQRRIRMLNQRTYLAAQERAVRIESLVSEMRTDLRSLKRRLDEEVKALGIDDTEAEKIIHAYYNNRYGASTEEEGGDEASPLKRSRSNVEMDLETEDEDDGPTQEVPP